MFNLEIMQQIVRNEMKNIAEIQKFFILFEKIFQNFKMHNFPDKVILIIFSTSGETNCVSS